MILIVEDDADNAAAIRDVLEEEGYTVTRACDGADALKKLQAGPLPGLILLDLMMPELDGSQVAKLIRAKPEWASIPLVLLSASGRAAELALAGQVAKFLHKPVDLTTLLEAVEKYYRRS